MGGVTDSEPVVELSSESSFEVKLLINGFDYAWDMNSVHVADTGTRFSTSST